MAHRLAKIRQLYPCCDLVAWDKRPSAEGQIHVVNALHHLGCQSRLQWPHASPCVMTGVSKELSLKSLTGDKGNL